jgi:glycosyltransferase involved in cell wall biosynthesis
VHRVTFGIGSLSLVVRSLEHARALGRAVADIHSREPIDLIETPEIFVSPGWVRDIPYVMRLHASGWMCRRMFGERAPLSDSIEVRLERYSLRNAAGVSAPSQSIANYIRQTCGVIHAIEIIPYPIDTTHFAPCSERENPPYVLFVGRVEERKGAAELMDAMPRVWARHPDCEFVFIGRVSDELAAQIEGLDGRAKFLGVRPLEDLVNWYQRAAIFVAPSFWDNSPNTIYEAMACGVPVVATRVGGIPELVDDGATGLLVPQHDSTALADAIISLLGDPTRRAQMGQRAREKVVAEYSVEKIAARTLEFYAREVG